LSIETSPAAPVDSVASKSSRWPRLLKRLALAAAALVALFVLRLTIGLGSAYAHYQSTPDFETFIAERAVTQAELESWLPVGELLARDTNWAIGEPQTVDNEVMRASFEITIEHGDERLLHCQVDVTKVADPETFACLGYSFACPSIQVRDGMRAIVQVGIRGKDALVGPAGVAGGSLLVDAVLVAGEGKDEFRVIELVNPPPGLDKPDIGLLWLRSVFGLVHPVGSLPEVGLVRQVRSRVTLTWTKTEGGAQSMGYSPPQGRTNCDEYSSKVTVNVRERDGGTSHTSSWSKRYTWNGETW
jgi:hypothetical protein